MDIFGSSEAAKILVIDDRPLSRVMAVDLLSANGYDVIEHDGISDIFTTIITASPDLILMDLKMPNYNGFDICQELKQNPDTRSIPIILMSVADDNKSRIKSQEVMADAFMSKPLESMILLPEVELLIQRKRLSEWLEQMQKVLFLISQALEKRYLPEGKSGIRFDKLAQGFGEYLNLSPVEISALILASHLHDIGTVAIPDAVMMKQGKLNEEERELIKNHVLIGEEICKPMQNRRGIAQIIRHHHERWDGSGYPDGLIGESIPKLAQIFQILDIYEALTSHRPYKQPYSNQEALNIITEEAEKGWRNVKLVQQFVAFMENKQLT
ncbi:MULTISPECIES: HD domain-containing phosphohydrolase [Crocosphaera]|uniref:Metal dependent phosphohydrolase, HD region with Response Regulator Receiver modulation n=3 Tax=Crocosphaera watsonii TaxID=263511 RepID=T2JR18_CROWT|nr:MULTISPECIES: HD domain-containing phosphohydrolase [Crocosphaera]MCH2245896.1 response regulator [Crocosphaera sp.]CCQ55865.1 Metal dependent phosphohydrolase, HD region with Response Regulator Receiver modulation [Crocosphaera watsonii WH 0005]CCQ67521.1 Metal dependent phosphohydrolase, HD region with Response Regulator Receiver modulation [Crocosphaera watsonii WH 0402]